MTIETNIKAAYTYGLSHIVLIGALALALVGCVYLYDSKKVTEANSKAALAETTAQIQDKNNAAYQSQLATQLADLTQRNTQLDAEFSSLSQSISSRNSSLLREQHQANVLQPSQLSDDWSLLIHSPQSVTFSQNVYQVTPDAAIKTVQQLEAVPILTSNLADEDKQIDTLKDMVGNTSKALGVETDSHKADQAACVVDKKALSDQLDKAKSDGRKGKLKWFGIGFVAGFVARLAGV
jgi:hypothetical protein